MFKRIKQIRKLEKSKLGDDEFYETDANNRGIIDVGAENYDDIFSYYDLNGENVLDDEFAEFLDKKAKAIPQKVELALHFHVKDPTEEKREEIERAIKNNYKREVRAINRKLQKNAKFSIYLLTFGLFSFGIYLLLCYLNAHFAITYIFDLIAYVFLWEVVDNHFLERKELQNKRLQMYRFVRADIDVLEYKKQSKQFHKKAKKIQKEKKIDWIKKWW